MSEQLPYDHYSGYPQPQQDAPPRRHKRRAIAAGVGAAVVVAGAAGAAYALSGGQTVQGTGETVAGGTILPRWGGGWDDSGSGGPGPSENPFGSGRVPGSGPGRTGGSGGAGTQQQASSAQSVGVVDIDTVLGYQNAEAAGTGMVVTPSGEILTNNHVVDGATKIAVTVVSTGKTYAASVVGTNPTSDVAVLRLSGASGLATAAFGNDSGLAVGQSVTGVGNAGGAGGTPSAATGTITALNKQITASDGSGANAERLSGLIETNAAIQSGDSGGPLYNSSGKVIGMDTAASTTGFRTTAGYAIPIDSALKIAAQIESATTSTGTIHLGYPAFLGVSVAAANGQGAGVEQALSGTPAARAGIRAGDVITAIDGTKITSPTTLESTLRGYRPGQSVTVTWVDTSGQTHHASVTLARGPAD